MKAGDYLFIQFGINDGDSACPKHAHFEAYGARRIMRLVTGALRTQNIALAGSLL